MKIMLSRQSTSALGTLAERVVAVSAKPEYAFVNENPLLSNLKAEYANYFTVYGKQAYSGMGAEVLKADGKRDAPLSGVKTILLGYSKIHGYELQQDAVELYAVFQRRGLDLDTFTYADESIEYDKLLEELDRPANAAKLERLHLTVPYGMMKAGQAEFKAIFLEQTSANKELRMMQSASSLRGNLETALRNYLNVVGAMKSIAGWDVLYTELDEVLKAAANSTTSVKQPSPVSTN